MPGNHLSKSWSAPVSGAVISALALLLGSAPAPCRAADVLAVTEYQVTDAPTYETTPTVGCDETGCLVVYTSRSLSAAGYGPGSIWYQRLAADGSPAGSPVLVSSGTTDDQLNDVSGQYIVYTAYPSSSSTTGMITVYDVAAGVRTAVAQGPALREARIHGTNVVWAQGGASSTTITLFDLALAGTGATPRTVAGPTPSAFNPDIGDRLVAFDVQIGAQRDVYAYDLVTTAVMPIATDPTETEWQAATSGPWVVWEVRTPGLTPTRIEAMNVDTGERRVIANNGTVSYTPQISGNLVTYESRVAGNFDIYVYRLDSGETFQLTTEPNDQRLNNVYGDLVAYVDNRNSTTNTDSVNMDVFVSKLTFTPIDPCAGRGGDADGDGVCGDVDNCPTVANPDQHDFDADGVGNLCDCFPALPPPVISYAGMEILTAEGVFYGELIHLPIANFAGYPAEMFHKYAYFGTCDHLAPASRTRLTFHDGETGAEVAVLCDASPESLSHLAFRLPPATARPPSVYVTMLDQQCQTTWRSNTVVVNTPPVADAGPDQAVTVRGTTVQLDGTKSWDAEGDRLEYRWTLVSKPPGSEADLASACTATPQFTADVSGTYVVQLVVSDAEQSAPDEVVVSFANVPPTADAGPNQLVNAGDTVQLVGSGTDANGDPLEFRWTIASAPSGSSAALADPTAPATTFVPDAPGSYTVELVVDDGLAASDPSLATITVLGFQDVVQAEIAGAVDAVNALGAAQLKNPSMQKTLSSKLAAVSQLVAVGTYADALEKLERDLLQKTNGCGDAGAPDRNDWITDCAAQRRVEAALRDAIAALQR